MDTVPAQFLTEYSLPFVSKNRCSLYPEFLSQYPVLATCSLKKKYRGLWTLLVTLKIRDVNKNRKEERVKV